MECKLCGGQNSEGNIYCIKCGKRLDGKKICPKCGNVIEEQEVYCPKCGTRIDGKTECAFCGEWYDGNFCPKCGKGKAEQAERGVLANTGYRKVCGVGIECVYFNRRNSMRCNGKGENW